MYAIAQVIYGIPLNSNDNENLDPTGVLTEAVEYEESGYLEYYNGGSDVPPRAFGVEISEFDECCHHIPLQDLRLRPTVDHLDQYQKLWNQQSPECQEALKKIGEPQVFILWTTS